MGGLELGQLAEEPVVLGVGELGRILLRGRAGWRARGWRAARRRRAPRRRRCRGRPSHARIGPRGAAHATVRLPWDSCRVCRCIPSCWRPTPCSSSTPPTSARSCPRTLVEPLLVALGAGAVVLLVCALLYRDLRRGALLASAIVVAFAFFGHLADQVDGPGRARSSCSSSPGPPSSSSSAIYALRARGSLPTVTATLNAFGLALVVMTLVTIVPAETSRAVRASEGEPVDDGTSSLGRHAASGPRHLLPGLRPLRLGLVARARLRRRRTTSTATSRRAGFQVVPGRAGQLPRQRLQPGLHAQHGLRSTTSTTSIGRASTDRTPVRERTGRHEVGRFLRANGYRYYHIGRLVGADPRQPHRRRGPGAGQDDRVRVGPARGQHPPHPRAAGSAATARTRSSRDQHRDQALFAFRQVQQPGRTPGRKFVFAHILMPHPPYVLAEGGRRVRQGTRPRPGRRRSSCRPQLDFTERPDPRDGGRAAGRPRRERPHHRHHRRRGALPLRRRRLRRRQRRRRTASASGSCGPTTCRASTTRSRPTTAA